MAAAPKNVLEVRGFLESKAATDVNECVRSLVSFLERKAKPPNGRPVRINQHYLQDDNSLLIEVDAAVAQRFTHLNGFSFAGAILQIEPYQDSRDHTHTNSQRGNASRAMSDSYRPQHAGNAKGDIFDRIANPHDAARLQPPSQPQQHQQQRRNPFAKPDRLPPTQPRGQLQSQQTNGTQPATKIPTQGGRFNDLDGIGEKFIRAFFPLYDTNREEALKLFYDDNSTFSLSVQTRSKSVKGIRQSVDWAPYIRFSRNLSKITNTKSRATRVQKGPYYIYEEWSQLPATQHPSLETHLIEWLLECTPITNLPDASGSGATVGGLLITTHGCFEDQTKEGKVGRRAFDRTFTIGPGSTPGSVRVISDVLLLRAYTGNFAYLDDARPNTPSQAPDTNLSLPQIPNGVPAIITTPAPTSTIQHPEIPPGSGIGEPRDGKSQEQLVKEQMVIQLSFATRLKVAMAEQALMANGGNMDAAKANVEQLKNEGKLGPDAFLNV